RLEAAFFECRRYEIGVGADVCSVTGNIGYGEQLSIGAGNFDFMLLAVLAHVIAHGLRRRLSSSDSASHHDGRADPHSWICHGAMIHRAAARLVKSAIPSHSSMAMPAIMAIYLCSAECFKYLWLEFRMHPLDNPAWSALTTHQSQIALVEGMARRYPPEMAVHGALALQMPQAWEALARLARVPVGVFSIAPLRLLPGWTVTRHVELFQMVHEGDGEAKRDLAIPITELSE